MRYLGVYIVRSKSFKCSLDESKKKFYRAANGIFGKIGRVASQEVIFKTTDMYTIATLQEMFDFELPSVRIARRTVKFMSKYNKGNCVFS